LTVVIFSSCSISPSKQIIPIASEKQPPPGKCLVIVERTSGATDQWVIHEIYDNQTQVGTLTRQGGKMVWVRDPGPMTLRAKVTWPGEPTYYRVIKTESGKAYRYIICDKPLLAGDLKLLDGPGAWSITRPSDGTVTVNSPRNVVDMVDSMTPAIEASIARSRKH